MSIHHRSSAVDEETIDRLFKELDALIPAKGKKTDNYHVTGKIGHRVKARKYGLKLNKTRHPFKGAA